MLLGVLGKMPARARGVGGLRTAGRGLPLAVGRAVSSLSAPRAGARKAPPPPTIFWWPHLGDLASNPMVAAPSSVSWLEDEKLGNDTLHALLDELERAANHTEPMIQLSGGAHAPLPSLLHLSTFPVHNHSLTCTCWCPW